MAEKKYWVLWFDPMYREWRKNWTFTFNINEAHTTVDKYGGGGGYHFMAVEEGTDLTTIPPPKQNLRY